MIAGEVLNGRELAIRLRIAGPTSRSTELDLLIDTGFTGYVTLPQAMIRSLELKFHGERDALLADGQIVPLFVYGGVAVWDGEERRVEIIEADASPLLGTAMLHGFHLSADFVPNGCLAISKIG